MNRKYYLGEIWLPIKGYEGLYEVSNYGRIRSLNYKKRGEVRVLRTTAMKGYYIKVGLRKGDKIRYFRVHRLVAIAFLPEPQSGQTQVEHIDCEKHHNYVNCKVVSGQIIVISEGTNLRWTHPKGNMANPLTRYHLSISHLNPSAETRARMSAGQRRRFARERATHTGKYAFL